MFYRVVVALDLPFGLPEPDLLCPAQDAADELRRLFAGETLRELLGLVDSHLGGQVLYVQHLVERETQDSTIYGAHAVYRPPEGDLAEPLIEGFTLLLDPTREHLRVTVDLPAIRTPESQSLAYRPGRHVTLVQR